jgi:hypothetical protein
MPEATEHIRAADPAAAVVLSRRRLVKTAGVTLLGAIFVGPGAMGATPAPFPHVELGPIAPQRIAGVDVGTLGGGSKPIYATRSGSQNGGRALGCRHAILR